MDNKIKPQNIYGLTVEQLDRKILSEIEKRFEEGHSNASVMAYLVNSGINISKYKVSRYRRLKFPHTLTIKSRQSMARKKKPKQDKVFSPAVYENEAEAISVEIQNLPDSLVLEDKALYIDALITKVNARIRHFDEIFVHTNKGGFNPLIDRVYQKYIELGKDLTESKARISGELDTTKITVINVVQSEISLLLDKIKSMIEDVAPEHIGEFKKRIAELYSNNMEVIGETKSTEENGKGDN